MPRTKLPALARRVRVDVTLSQATIAVLDALVAAGHAPTRSAAVEAAVMAFFASVPRPGDVAPSKRAKTKVTR